MLWERTRCKGVGMRGDCGRAHGYPRHWLALVWPGLAAAQATGQGLGTLRTSRRVMEREKQPWHRASTQVWAAGRDAGGARWGRGLCRCEQRDRHENKNW